MQQLDTPQVALIGAGKLGLRLVRRLLVGGYRPLVWDLSPSQMESCRAMGAVVPTDTGHLWHSADIVLLVLPSPEAVSSAVMAPGGPLFVNRKGLIVADLSTNHPKMSRELAEACAANGVAFLDAPVTGGLKGAENGTLTVMAGGDPGALAAVKPVLETFAAHIVHVGGHGDGAATKLLHNMLGEIQVYAIAEAFCVAAKLGLDLNRVYDVLSHGMATSRILTELYANGALAGSLEPSATVLTAEKDQRLLLSMASDVGVTLTFTPLVYDMIQALIGKGMGTKDVTAAIQVFEERIGVVARLVTESPASEVDAC